MLSLPGIVEGIRTRKDQTLAITIGTNELTPEKAAQLLALSNRYGFFIIKEADFTPDELDLVSSLEPTLEDGVKGKSKSQRLRAVMYLLHKERPEGFKDFDSFYAYKMEAIIEHFKKQLPNE